MFIEFQSLAYVRVLDDGHKSLNANDKYKRYVYGSDAAKGKAVAEKKPMDSPSIKKKKFV